MFWTPAVLGLTASLTTRLNPMCPLPLITLKINDNKNFKLEPTQQLPSSSGGEHNIWKNISFRSSGNVKVLSWFEMCYCQ